LGRHFAGFIDLPPEIINLDGDGKAWIGLYPDCRIGPVIAFVDRRDVRKPAASGIDRD
jgi:hypothetical protein